MKKRLIFKKKIIFNNRILLVFLFFFVVNFVIISTKLKPIANYLLTFKINQQLNQNIVSGYDFSLDNNYKLNDLIILKYNEKKEIISMQYDIDKTNKLLNEKSQKIKSIFKNTDSKNMLFKDNHVLIKIPLGIITNNTLLNNFGPYIPVLYSFYNKYLISFKTEIKSYGINTALVELYIIINVDIAIESSMQNTIHREYKYIMSSMIVEGKVPSIIGSNYQNEIN